MTTPPQADAVHPDPVWRHRSDFIIGARIQDQNRSEQLWARDLGDQRFEICCIPFFLYDVALGDVVRATLQHDLDEVLEPSGRFVFRAWFGDADQPHGHIPKELAAFDTLLEWSSENLLAIDASDEDHAHKIADYLAQQEQAGRLKYETGES